MSKRFVTFRLRSTPSRISYFAEASKIDYDNRLAVAGFGKITTQILEGGRFWAAHDAHQQYLEKNPDGYCGLQGTGVEASLPNPDPI